MCGVDVFPQPVSYVRDLQRCPPVMDRLRCLRPAEEEAQTMGSSANPGIPPRPPDTTERRDPYRMSALKSPPVRFPVQSHSFMQ